MRTYGYPIANWLDESTYPDPEKMTGTEVAWEYIRRNPEYQKDFETCKNPPSLRYKWNLISKWFCEGRGIVKMLDPKKDKFGGLKLHLKSRPLIIEKVASGPSNTMNSPFQFKYDMVAVFNLGQKISPQIEDVQKFLISEQKKRKIKTSRSGPQKAKHKLYWRLIDAKSQKIPNKEIRKIFKFKYEYPDVDQLKDRLKQAHIWRDGEYIKLVNLGKSSLKRNPKAKNKGKSTTRTSPRIHLN